MTVETEPPNPNEELMIDVAARAGPDISCAVDRWIGNRAEEDASCLV